MVKLVICAALLVHGVGHVLFLAPTVRLAEWADQTGRSWLAEPLLGDGAARLVGGAAWAVAMVLFVSAAIGLYFDADWWRVVAGVGAVVSAVAIVTFWTGLSTSSAVFALAFDIVVVVGLLLTRTAGTELAGN